MITVNKEPDSVDLSGNYLPLWLESDDTLESAGVKCSGSISWSAIPSNDDTLIFEFTQLGKTVTITFKTTPDDSGNQIGIAGSSVINWITNTLIPALQANYLLDKAFLFSRDGSDLDFITRTETNAYNVSIDTGGTSATASVTNGVAPVPWPDFRIRVLLEVRRLNDTLVAERELELSPATDEVYFELSPVLRYLHSKQVPSLASRDVQDLSATSLKYRYRYAEVRNTPAQVRKLAGGTWRFVLPGGKSIEGLINLDSFSTRYLPGGSISRFLSLADTRKILADQDFLISWFPASGAISDINYRVTFKYSDGTSSAAIVVDNFSGVQFPGIYSFNVGFGLLSNLADASKTVDSYEIRVNESLSAVSTVYTLELSREPKMDLLQVVYRNSLGAYEVWAFKGQVNRQARVVRENGRITLLYPSASTDRDKASVFEELEDSIVARTGYLTKTEIDLFREVLLSDDVYLLEGGKLWPCLIEATDIATHDTYSYERNSAEVVITRQSKEYLYA